MADNKKFVIIIGAVDQFSPTFQKAIKSVVAADKSIEDTRKNLKKVSTDPALGLISKQLGEIGLNAKDAVGALGTLVPGIETLAGIGTIGGLALLTRNVINTNAAIDRSSRTLGINSQELQAWQGANIQAGGSAEGTVQAFGTLASTLQAGIFGRDPTALNAMARLGIGIHRTKDGAIGFTESMRDLQSAFTNTMLDPTKGIEGAKNLVRQFGLEEFIPLLIRGAETTKEFQQRWIAIGGVVPQKALDTSTQLYEKLELIGGGAYGAAARLVDAYAPALNKIADDTIRVVGAFNRMLDVWNSMTGTEKDFGMKLAFAERIPAFQLGWLSMENKISDWWNGGKPASANLPGSTMGGQAGFIPTGGGMSGTPVRSTVGANGEVEVHIRIDTAHPNTTATVQQSGAVNASARVEHAMPTGAP